MQAGLSTQRCDRPRAEAAVRTAYRTAGLDEPPLIVWMDSPLGGMFAAGIIKSAATVQLDGPVWTLLGAQPWDQVVAQLGSELAQHLWMQLHAQLGDQLGTQLKEQLSEPLEHQLYEPQGRQLSDNLRDGLWSQLKDQVGGHTLSDQLQYQLQDPPTDPLWEQVSLWRDCAWLATMTCALRLAGLTDSRLDALCAVSREVDWWWPMNDAVVLTDRPTAISRDSRGLLHTETGSALAYADGYALRARHGTLLPPV